MSEDAGKPAVERPCAADRTDTVPAAPAYANLPAARPRAVWPEGWLPTERMEVVRRQRVAGPDACGPVNAMGRSGRPGSRILRSTSLPRGGPCGPP